MYTCIIGLCGLCGCVWGCVYTWAVGGLCGAVGGLWGCVLGLCGWACVASKSPTRFNGWGCVGCGCGCGYCLGVVIVKIKLITMQAAKHKPATNNGLLNVKVGGNKTVVGIIFTFLCGWVGLYCKPHPVYFKPGIIWWGLCPSCW